MHFRFTIRDLLWLTLVVALAVGWWLDRSRLAGPAAEAPVLKKQLDATMSHFYDTDELKAQIESLQGQLETLRAGVKK